MSEENELIVAIRRLAQSKLNEGEHDLTAGEVSAAICYLMGEISLKDDKEDGDLADWEEEMRKQRCKLIGEHDWQVDQCRYWGHQFCVGCNKSKYPELQKLRVSEAIRKIGDITEEEYIKRLDLKGGYRL